MHECVPQGRAKPHVEVRIDDERIGQLTAQTSQRFLPMIRHLRERGLVTACWGDITGSAVAAEVRVDGIKANEATADVLEGPPITIPPLVPERADLADYNLIRMWSLLNPLALVQPVTPPTPTEPPDGCVIRFAKSGGRYNYVAVRRGNHWETTATADWGSINEIMIWNELAPRAGKMEIALDWKPMNPLGDPRIRQYLAVVRFTINGLYLAAINVGEDGGDEGDWYTTINDRAEDHLPLR